MRRGIELEPSPMGESGVIREIVPPQVRRAPAGSRHLLGVFLRILLPTILGIAWQIGATAGWIDDRFFPPPSVIWSTAVELVGSGDLQAAIGISLRRIAIGFSLGAAAGIAAGVALGMSRVARLLGGPILSALYTIPKLALLPMFLLLFGIGETPLVALLAVSVFFFMWIGTMGAVMSVSDEHLAVARSFGATQRQQFRHVILPSMIPDVIIALHLSAGVAVLSLVGIEFLASSSGIGHLIWFSWQLFMADRMYVGIITVAVMGVIISMAVQWLGRVACPWAEKEAVSTKEKF